MYPRLFGFTTYTVSWVVAAVVGVGLTMRDARRAGLPVWRSLIAACAVAATIVLGAKLLYVVEHMWLPEDAAQPWGQESVIELLRYGFRIPGGVLLVAFTLPLICRAVRLPTLRFADLSFPGIGIALVFVRLGCFLNGCCFGRPTTSILAIEFPPGAQVYGWQLAHGLISAPAPHTLPVHPLQLYFALLGLGVYVLAGHIQRSQRFNGQVWMGCYLLFFGSTFFLELLRPQPLHLNLALCAAVVLVTLGLRLRALQPAGLAIGLGAGHSALLKVRPLQEWRRNSL
jgi:phosphatidylglycerol:prolipoprotein diacylglycerol transferase